MNKYEQRSKNSYDKKAENYDSTFDGKFTVKFKRMLYDNINVHADDVVADIACGNGRFLNMLAKEAGRVIRKEGLLYIAEVYLPGFLRVLANPFIRFSKSGDVKFYSPKEIVSLFEGCGFIRKDVIISGMVQLVILQKV